MMVGKVWLVGAGPSDPGLITVKGKQVLEQAQVVVYDQLVGAGILSMMPQGAELIDVGKQAGNHKVTQENINRILLEKAKEGKRVVRLKGGDPFLFGRGGEELEALVKEQIPFEVVPGVTSALAVPAYAGIPVTHRDYTSSLHIITAHKKKGSDETINYQALAALGDVTLVFLMGVSALPRIVHGLMEAGVEAERPCAVIENGTRYNQRYLTAPLNRLEEEAGKIQIGTPGIIVVGRVCELAEQFHWAENRPLGGARVIVTRPKEKSSRMAAALCSLGAEVVELPAIRLEAVKQEERFLQAAEDIKEYRWLLFTSEAGVRFFFEKWLAQGKDIRELAHLNFGAVGNSTADALRKWGILADYVPHDQYAKELGEGIASLLKPGEKVLLCLPEQVSSDCSDRIEAKGFCCDLLPVYEISYEKQNAFHINPGDIAAFTSAACVTGFIETMKMTDYSQIQAVFIGRKTMEQAKRYGISGILAKEVSISGMIDTMIEVHNKRKKDQKERRI